MGNSNHKYLTNVEAADVLGSQTWLVLRNKLELICGGKTIDYPVFYHVIQRTYEKIPRVLCESIFRAFSTDISQKVEIDMFIAGLAVLHASHASYHQHSQTGYGYSAQHAAQPHRQNIQPLLLRMVYRIYESPQGNVLERRRVEDMLFMAYGERFMSALAPSVSSSTAVMTRAGGSAAGNTMGAVLAQQLDAVFDARRQELSLREFEQCRFALQPLGLDLLTGWVRQVLLVFSEDAASSRICALERRYSALQEAQELLRLYGIPDFVSEAIHKHFYAMCAGSAALEGTSVRSSGVGAVGAKAELDRATWLREVCASSFIAQADEVSADAEVDTEADGVGGAVSGGGSRSSSSSSSNVHNSTNSRSGGAVWGSSLLLHPELAEAMFSSKVSVFKPAWRLYDFAEFCAMFGTGSVEVQAAAVCAAFKHHAVQRYWQERTLGQQRKQREQQLKQPMEGSDLIIPDGSATAGGAEMNRSDMDSELEEAIYRGLCRMVSVLATPIEWIKERRQAVRVHGDVSVGAEGVLMDLHDQLKEALQSIASQRHRMLLQLQQQSEREAAQLMERQLEGLPPPLHLHPHPHLHSSESPVSPTDAVVQWFAQLLVAQSSSGLLPGLRDLGMTACCRFGVPPAASRWEQQFVTELSLRHLQVHPQTALHPHGPAGTAWNLLPKVWLDAWRRYVGHTPRSSEREGSYGNLLAGTFGTSAPPFSGPDGGITVTRPTSPPPMAAATTAGLSPTAAAYAAHLRGLDLRGTRGGGGGGGGAARPPRPGRIDNWPLLQLRGGARQLVPGLRVGVDVEAVPPAVFSALVSWYGGGPHIARSVIEVEPPARVTPSSELPSTAATLTAAAVNGTAIAGPVVPRNAASNTRQGGGSSTGSGPRVDNSTGAVATAQTELELYPLCVRVCTCDSGGLAHATELEREVLLSRAATVGDVARDLALERGVDPARARLWNYLSMEWHEQFILSPELSLRQARLKDGQRLLLELSLADGSWPRSQLHAKLDSEERATDGSPGVADTAPGVGEEEEGSDGFAESDADSSAINDEHSWQKRKAMNGAKNSRAPAERTQKREQLIELNNGRVGMHNLGNTCYMNSSVQALLHIQPLVSYFLSEQYLRHVNTHSIHGYKGRLALAFAKLARELWSSKQAAISPKAFMREVAALRDQFAGAEQHDAHELLAFLLDGLSEDLDLVRCAKPYIEHPDSDGRPDSELADIWWANHLQRERSVVQALFTGQFKSVTTCTACGRYESARFEPFNVLSLPIPEDSCQVVAVSVLPLQLQHSTVCSVRVSRSGTLHDVLQKVLELQLPGLTDARSSAPTSGTSSAIDMIQSAAMADSDSDSDSSDSDAPDVEQQQQQQQPPSAPRQRRWQDMHKIPRGGSKRRRGRGSSERSNSRNSKGSSNSSCCYYFQAGELVHSRIKSFNSLDRRVDSIRPDEHLALFQIRRATGDNKHPAADGPAGAASVPPATATAGISEFDHEDLFRGPNSGLLVRVAFSQRRVRVSSDRPRPMAPAGTGTGPMLGGGGGLSSYANSITDFFHAGVGGVGANSGAGGQSDAAGSSGLEFTHLEPFGMSLLEVLPSRMSCAVLYQLVAHRLAPFLKATVPQLLAHRRRHQHNSNNSSSGHSHSSRAPSAASTPLPHGSGGQRSGGLVLGLSAPLSTSSLDGAAAMAALAEGGGPIPPADGAEIRSADTDEVVGGGPIPPADGAEIRSADTDEVVGGAIPSRGFTLRLINGGTGSGTACSRCHWLQRCQGCVLPDSPSVWVTLRDGESVAIDWHYEVYQDLLDVHALTHLRRHPSVGREYASACDARTPLQRCLDKFTEQEPLEDVVCPRCKESGGEHLRRSFALWRLPPVLIVQLKRFQFDQHSRRKLTDRVSFPLEGLDLGAYLAPAMEATQQQERQQREENITSTASLADSTALAAQALYGEDEVKEPSHTYAAAEPKLYPGGSALLQQQQQQLEQCTSYDLFAVIHHAGALGGGHYAATVRHVPGLQPLQQAHCKGPGPEAGAQLFSSSDPWLCFNDNLVSAVANTAELSAPSAYVLFYMRRDVQRASAEQLLLAYLDSAAAATSSGSGPSSVNSTNIVNALSPAPPVSAPIVPVVDADAAVASSEGSRVDAAAASLLAPTPIHTLPHGVVPGRVGLPRDASSTTRRAPSDPAIASSSRSEEANAAQNSHTNPSSSGRNQQAGNPSVHAGRQQQRGTNRVEGSVTAAAAAASSNLPGDSARMTSDSGGEGCSIA